MILFEGPNLEKILREKEGQLFGFKSARLDHREIATHFVAFANADGGVLAIGIEKDGKFETTLEYPVFAWQEAISNAVIHRAYSITGTDIQVKMFDDRLEVESPGKLPGLVRLHNMREIHFSRNPLIARVMTEMKYMRDFGEGVDRMFREMETMGLEPPIFEE